VILPVIFLTRSVDWTDDQNLLWARVAFALSQLLGILVWIWVAWEVKSQATSAAARKRVLVPAQAASAWSPADSTRSAENEAISALEYDERELSKLRNQALSKAAIILAIHWYWGAAVPLVIQVVSTPLSLWKEPLVQLYLRRQDLARPFPVAASPLAGLFGTQSQDTGDDKKTKKKARRAAAGKDD